MTTWDSVRGSLLICALIGHACSGMIIATVGTDVTLTCNYDAQYYGKLPVCWGRGSLPNRGCANEVIKFDGTSVISRLSERYLLLGNMGQGDASLTVRQVEEGDSGIYGCRVDIPGWFNDFKHEISLTVHAVRPNPLKIEISEVKERSITIRWTPGFDGGRPITGYIIHLKQKLAQWDSALRTEIYNPELTQVTLVDLRPAKAYNIRMFADNIVGMSEASDVITVTTKEGAPEGAPLDMRLEAISSHSIKVSWKPPRADLRNGVLRSYSVSYREYDSVGKHFREWRHLSVTPRSGEESVVLKNLKPSSKYGVIVQARTNAGIGPASTAPYCSTLDEVHEMTTPSSLPSTLVTTVWIHHLSSTSASRPQIIPQTTFWEQNTATSTAASTPQIIPQTTFWEQSTATSTAVAPDPPVVQLKEVKDNTISIFWTPGFEGDSPISEYRLEYKAANASWDNTKTVVDFGPNQTEATIIEINPSMYNLRMFARNSRDTSKASNVLTITTGEPGHQMENFTTISTDTQTVSAEESPGGHLAAIVVPVVLVVLTVAIVTAWQLRRQKRKKGILNMLLPVGGLRLKGAESLQEL
ncbi:unnamed protein product [Ophioblennius macclurei]